MIRILTEDMDSVLTMGHVFEIIITLIAVFGLALIGVFRMVK